MNDKIFFLPGDLVQLRQDIPNKPIMLVYKIERSILKRNNDDLSVLRGCKVRWFTDNGFLQEAVFSTKDLELVQ